MSTQDCKFLQKILLSQSSQTLVELTPMSFIPGFQVAEYLGNMNLFVIRETSSVREFGGISGFMHKFVAEVLALMRAHVAALGGNALLAFNLNQCVLLDNPNRNQAQCLINIAGDAVRVVPEKNAAENWHGMHGSGVAKAVYGSGGAGGSSGKSASPQSPKLRAKEAPPKGGESTVGSKEVDKTCDRFSSPTSANLFSEFQTKPHETRISQRISQCDDALLISCKSIRNDLNNAYATRDTREPLEYCH